jgi:Flp pilus assembly protein TadG
MTFRHRHYRRSQRRAVALVESAIVLPVCLLLLLGMLELSVALVRHTVMSEAARRVARAAMIHGANATVAQGQWGPSSLSINAGDSHAAATAVRDVLMTLDPAQVQIAIQWPDGGNLPDQRVSVAVTYLHQPIVPIPGWYDHLDLQGHSTMRIAH